MSEEEPKWFSRYVKTHDQDHQQLERKIEELEKRCDLFNRLDTESAKIEQGLQKQIKELEEKLESYTSQLEEMIEELEQKLDSHIDHFQIALQEIIYKHINTQGDEYGEDIQELLRMMDGFRERHGTKQSKSEYKPLVAEFAKEEPFICDECGFVFKYGFLGPNKKTIFCPNCYRENDIERRKDPPADDKTPDEIIIEQWKHLYKDYYNERLQNQRDEFLADLKKGWKYVIAKEKYWIARNKVSYQMIFQELLDINRLIYGKWQKKKERD